MALRIALAIFRWLTGRRPVTFRCLMRPMAVIYSDMIEKFCYWKMTVNQMMSIRPFHITIHGHGRDQAYLVEIKRIPIQGIKSIRRRTLAPPPFLHLCRTKIMWCVDVACFPLAGLKFLQRPVFLLRFPVFDEFPAVQGTSTLKYWSGGFCSLAYSTA